MKKQSESALVKACLDLLHYRGCFCWRNNTGGLTVGKRFVRFGAVGSPDIIGVVGPATTPKSGRLIAVEVKVGKNQPTPAQAMFLATIADYGGYAWVVRSIGELQELLDECGI